MDYSMPSIFYLFEFCFLAWMLYLVFQNRKTDLKTASGAAWVSAVPVISTVMLSEKVPLFIALVISGLWFIGAAYCGVVFMRRHIAKERAEEEARELRIANNLKKLDDYLRRDEPKREG